MEFVEDDLSTIGREIAKKGESMVFLSAPRGNPLLNSGKGNSKLVQGKTARVGADSGAAR